jgi:TonB family protein
VIDAIGNVESATIVSSIHPQYDDRLLEAAKGWKYRPAQRGGKPVKFVKVMEIVLRP